MTQVLIISKTKMYKDACIGGIIIPDLISVRLLNADGSYHKADTEFNVGQVWEMELKPATKIIPPHYENVLIQSKNYIEDINSFSQIIDQEQLNKIVWVGHPQNLFQGHLSWTGSRNGYIKKGEVPEMSTGFWIPDKDLNLVGKYYIYDDGNKKYDSTFGFKYVGFEPPIQTISAGKKVRVSLAKWWSPDDIDIENRCYLQLSGWYNT